MKCFKRSVLYASHLLSLIVHRRLFVNRLGVDTPVVEAVTQAVTLQFARCVTSDIWTGLIEITRTTTVHVNNKQIQLISYSCY